EDAVPDHTVEQGVIDGCVHGLIEATGRVASRVTSRNMPPNGENSGNSRSHDTQGRTNRPLTRDTTGRSVAAKRLASPTLGADVGHPGRTVPTPDRSRCRGHASPLERGPRPPERRSRGSSPAKPGLTAARARATPRVPFGDRAFFTRELGETLLASRRPKLLSRDRGPTRTAVLHRGFPPWQIRKNHWSVGTHLHSKPLLLGHPGEAHSTEDPNHANPKHQAGRSARRSELVGRRCRRPTPRPRRQ